MRIEMRIPVIQGVIDRRILVNFRVRPEVLSPLLPPPFRPQVVLGWGIAGICLIRLKHIRPWCLPQFIGIASENAAHRIAVEWECKGGRCSGVYIPRRDTSSVVNCIAGGRLFPGVHHLAKFDVREADDRYRVTLDSRDGVTHLDVDGHVSTTLPGDSIFRSLADASEFFQRGSLGYSPAQSAGAFDGLELRTRDWCVEPLAVDRLESSFFADRNTFPEGSAIFDCALLMRHVRHEWRVRESLAA
jgi:hypothetical protein